MLDTTNSIFKEKDLLESTIEHSGNVDVEYSDRGHDNAPQCLLSSSRDSKWCLNFVPRKTFVKFIFDKPIEL